MTLLSLNRIAWTYTDDLGNAYRVAAQKALTDQDKLGGSAAASTVPPKPAGIKMRRATVRSASLGVSRSVPIYDADTADLLIAEAAINLNHLADSGAFVWQGNIIAERRPRTSTTSQAT